MGNGKWIVKNHDCRVVQSVCRGKLGMVLMQGERLVTRVD